MRDQNICECGCAFAVDARRCSHCGAEMYAPARGLTLWVLEGTSTALVPKLASRLERRFGREVHISPSRIAAGSSRRARPWAGHSAVAFLNQLDRRTRRGEFALGITGPNIEPSSSWNYLFGLAYLNGRCAVMSLHPLRLDGASTRTVLARAEKIAVHELGHAVGLDDQPYDHGSCVMCGEVEHDSLETVDDGTAEFCNACAQRIRRHLVRYSSKRLTS